MDPDVKGVSSKKSRLAVLSLILVIVSLVAVYLFWLRWDRITYYEGTPEFDEYGNLIEEESCNVIGLNIHGEIVTYLPEDLVTGDYTSAEDVVYSIENAEADSDIKAILVEVDSYGGSPVASSEIANILKSSQLPVVAMIRGTGASGGYWIASSADYIFASKMSDIGSIGVTMSYVDDAKLNQKEGYTWNSLSTGKFKDIGSPEKELTKEEREIFERDLGIIFEEFIKEVATNRSMSIEQVRALADGSSVLGEMAKEKGLIDQIGFLPEVKEYLKKTLNVEPEICWN